MTHQGGRPFDDSIFTGILVEGKNPMQLADAIELLTNDRKLCNQMGIAGRKKYEQQFTLPVFKRRIAECIKNLL